MSAAPGLDPVAPRPAARARRRAQLALVPAPRTVLPTGPLARTPFVVLVVTLLAAGLIGLLVLNTALAQDAFRLHTLKQDSRALEDREEELLREVEALRAPHELAARASALGMVPAGPPAFLRLSDGAVLGAETPAVVPPSPGEEAPGEEAPAATAPTDEAASDSESQASDDGSDEAAQDDAAEAPAEDQ